MIVNFYLKFQNNTAHQYNQEEISTMEFFLFWKIYANINPKYISAIGVDRSYVNLSCRTGYIDWDLTNIIYIKIK